MVIPKERKVNYYILKYKGNYVTIKVEKGVEMEQEKNNKGVIVLLIVLVVILAVLCVLFATGTISFNSNSVNNGNDQSNGSVSENNNTATDNTIDNSQVSSSWTSYLLSRHILEAKVTRVRSKDLGDAEDYNKTVTITMDDVKTILSSLENKKLLKMSL